MKIDIIQLQNFIQATRDSGYTSVAQALAEIIDNSIEAGATCVNIQINKDSKDFEIAVLDNGCAMSPKELMNALRFGGTDRFNSRKQFGRYGMGLPNSSLSQCKRLEVFTWKNRTHTYWNYLDVDEIISYAVVDRMIRNDDGVFHWYADEFSAENHNYYWYEDPANQRIHLIPWDLDNAFDNITDQSPVTAIADEWGHTTNNCEPFPYGPWQIWQWSASCDKITKGWTMYTEEYDQKKEEFKNLFLLQSYSLIDTWVEQIHGATLEAEQAHKDALPIEKWDESIELLKTQIELISNQ